MVGAPLLQPAGIPAARPEFWPCQLREGGLRLHPRRPLSLWTGRMGDLSSPSQAGIASVPSFLLGKMRVLIVPTAEGLCLYQKTVSETRSGGPVVSLGGDPRNQEEAAERRKATGLVLGCQGLPGRSERPELGDCSCPIVESCPRGLPLACRPSPVRLDADGTLGGGGSELTRRRRTLHCKGG